MLLEVNTYFSVPNKRGGLIKGEGGRSLKKNKRGGSNKRGRWHISQN